MTTPDVFTPIERLADSMPRTIPPIHQRIHAANRWVDRLDRWIAPAWCWIADRLIPSPALTSLPPPRAGQPAGRLVEPPALGSEPAGTTFIPGRDPDCWIDPTHITGHRCHNAAGMLVGPGEACELSIVGREVFERFEKDHPQWAEQ